MIHVLVGQTKLSLVDMRGSVAARLRSSAP
jgi:hypothetical protein